MLEAVDRIGVALLDASLAAVAISGLVVLVMVQCRQPARRRGWARAGLISTLALLPMAALNPVPRLDLRGPIRQIWPTALDDPALGGPALGGPALGGPGLDGPAFDGGAGREEGHEAGACPPAGPRWARWVARGMVVAYGVGTSAGLGWMLLGVWGSAWVVRRGGPASSSTIGLYRALPFEGSTTSRPRLLVSGRATRPVLVGWLRPAILIPTGLDRPTAAEPLRLSLLHELAHAEQADHRFGPAATLAQAIWFFVPPVWWIRDQLKLDQEFLADRRAVAHYGTSGRYASSLVDLASAASTGRRGGAAPATATATATAGGAARRDRGLASALVQRVQMLLRCPFAIEGQSPLWWRWSTALTLAFATLAASCLTLRGMAGGAGAAPPPPASSPRSFRVPQLVVSQRENDDRPFDLRFRLPDRFTLTFEVMAEPAELPTIEVLGHRLGPPAPPGPAPGVAAYRLWHRVEVRRSAGVEAIEVDGRTLAEGSGPSTPAPWLTIGLPPGKTARLRDLVLLW